MISLFLHRNELLGGHKKRKKEKKKRIGNQKKGKIIRVMIRWLGQRISLVTLLLQLVEMINCEWLTIKVVLAMDLI